MVEEIKRDKLTQEQLQRHQDRPKDFIMDLGDYPKDPKPDDHIVRIIKDLIKQKQRVQLKELKLKQKAQQEKLTKQVMQKLLQMTHTQTLQLGSVAYGLPTVALTRRTIDTCIRSKQLETVNNKMI